MDRRRNSVVFGLSLAGMIALPGALLAQDAWVQIEAQRTLTGAQDAARGYAARGVENVNGFFLPSGWYGIALGPFEDEADAEVVLRQLRAAGLIPGDSYIVDGTQFRQQYWPVGGATGGTVAVTPEVTPDTTAEAPVEVPEIEVPRIAVPDETVAEARASEAELSIAQKQELQVALQWAGFYNGAIDGLYGRGTRSSMEAWQVANNQEPTGILTSGQRAALLAAYNAVLEGMDLQTVRDDATGIEMQIPTGVVSFAGYEAPFARFDATGDIPAQVLLISQPGDQARMFGLYEIMQTLEIVPPEGPRERRDRSFELEGIGSEIHSYTYVTLTGEGMKGFTLVWPAGDEERRARVLAAMRDSFTPVDGILSPALATTGADQAVDLVSGLQIRTPIKDRSGFFINGSGDVLTTAEAIAGCGSITLAKTHDAAAVHVDEALGIAVLRSSDTLAPAMVAEFQLGIPRIQAEVAVAGFPYGGVLATPALTFGTLADIRGLNGEEEVKRLSIFAQAGDTGGPVFDNGGAVLGMLLPREVQNGQVLPAEVSFSLDAETITGSLDGAGVPYQTTSSVAYMTPEALTQMAANMTVLVSCWQD